MCALEQLRDTVVHLFAQQLSVIRNNCYKIAEHCTLHYSPI